jgi:hypothetical protein
MRGLLPFLTRVFGNADKADWIVILTTTGIVLFVIVGIVIVVVLRSLRNIGEKKKLVNQKEYSPGDIKTLRNRAKYEDGLLNARTSIVLVFNGLMAAAANIASTGPSTAPAVFGVAGFAFFFNALWLPCALQHGSYMRCLSRIIQDSENKPIDEKIRIDNQRKRWPYGPTVFMTFIMPILLTFGWILWLLWIIMSP